ncbi:AAA family ATPase [Arthrobacter sp. NQ7]|uniref:helix-turn-helix transcriptional regulator n=1 Tax=Arthrobacter sp. NQ7 TaxID=3032303 RepID=UPI0024107781|nr:LuxR family transcriptional regulator [Arthrobacter sp. NQ7]MDJ0458359.1 AAA family ATPase [Arthrobacter sp. NQ7]
MPLVGRRKELDRILSVIRGPKDTALAVAGPQGVGKTALLSAIPTLSNNRSIVLHAAAAESGWPLSGLTALLNEMDDPVLNRIAGSLPGKDAQDLPAAAGMLLTGLRQRLSPRTVIVIDDADRMDPASQAVIGFLARRLAGTDTVLFAGLRNDHPGGPFGGLPTLRLGPLSFSDTVRMLESMAPRRITTAAAQAVAAAAGGNPLAAVELHAQLVEKHAGGRSALPFPLPASGSFDAGFAAQVAMLSPGPRHVLDLLALSRHTDISAISRTCGGAWTWVDGLLAAGLVKRSGPHVGIVDQLLREYIFRSMAPAERLAGHREMAAAADGNAPHARTWHLSFTEARPQMPLQLLRHARDLAGEGEVPMALEYVERALAIDADHAGTAAELAGIAELLFSRGEFAYARRYLEWAQRLTPDPALILRLAGLDFEIQFAQGAAVRSSALLRLVKEFGRHDPEYSAGLLATGACYYAERWELQVASEVLQASADVLRLAGDGSAAAQHGAMARQAGLLMDVIGGGTADPARKDGHRGAARAQGLLVSARALTYAERYDGAREAFALLRNSSGPGSAIWQHAAAILAVDNEIRAGNDRRAVRLIDDLELSEPDLQYHRGMRHLFRVWRAHSVGDEGQARVAAAEALRYAGGEDHPALTAQLAACQGHFALLRGDLAESVAQLSRAAETGSRFGNPTLLRSGPDLVEALIRLGRHQEATQALLHLEARSAGLRSPWLAMAVARSRAMLADGEQSLQLFREALEGRSPHTLERARTLMCYSERLHAFGRLRDARDALLRAKVLFDEAGADAWTQHLDSLLLDERMEPASPQGNPALLLLSEHERALARMVARGMRNKEIAGTLYVSVRTVEVRLTAIYRKLGVESRAQLTALAAGKGTKAPEPYVLPVL